MSVVTKGRAQMLCIVQQTPIVSVLSVPMPIPEHTVLWQIRRDDHIRDTVYAGHLESTIQRVQQPMMFDSG